MAQPTQEQKDNNVMAALSYVFVLCFVPLLLSKNSPYVQFHAKQGLVLFIAEVAVMIIATIFVFIPIIGWLANIAMYLFVVVMAIMGFINALGGKKWVMPLLGSYAKKLKI
ncbi:DUF4870 domain-containing protein [Candidatus Uhrbacteria bacterium]|jgi:fumarate reductase subunit D|nr:DUF4870 domain-containing protein [Candidatus Uhrbacteria bacterium]